MQRKTFLSRYQVSLNGSGQPLEIGRSSNAVVYKAEDTAAGGEVALEVISAANLSQSIREQLEAEASRAKRLNHINIPTLHDFGFDGEEMVYVTDEFDGTTAEDWVKSHGPLPTGTVLRVALQAVSALGAAAFHSIFHYAINPQNIILVPGQTPQGDWPLIKVLHFIGLAPVLVNSGPASMDPAAPVKFASPEQARTGDVDFRSEMYSLGCVLWFLLTGEAPQGGAAAVESAGGMSGPVKRLLGRMLATDPDERPLDPLALQQEIQDCISHLERLQAVAGKFGLVAPSSTAPIQASATEPRALRRPASAKRLALAALLLGLGLMAAFVVPDRLRSKRDAAGGDQELIGLPIGVPQVLDDNRTAAANQGAPATLESNASGPSATVAPAPSATRALIPESTSARVVADTRNILPAETPVSSPLDQDISEPAPVVTSVIGGSPAQNGEALSQAAPAEGTGQSWQVADNGPAAGIDSIEEQPSLRDVERAPTDKALTGGDASPKETAEETSFATRDANAVAQAFRDGEGLNASAAPITSRTISKSDRRTGTISRAKTNASLKGELAGKIRAPAKKTRIALAEGQPSLPRGVVRAEFLGTTPEGNLIFGLPSSERGFLAAPSTGREGSSRRRARALAKPAPKPAPEELPVLPALPPD